MRWRRLVTVGLGTPLVLLVLIVAVLYFTRGVALRGLVQYIERKVNAGGAVRVAVDGVSGDPLSEIILTGVRLTAGRGGSGAKPFFEADTLVIDYAMGNLFGERRVRSVRIVRPRLAADALPKKSALSDGPGRFALAALPAAGIDSLRLVEGSVSGLPIPGFTGVSLDAEIRVEAGRARAALRGARAVFADSIPIGLEGSVSLSPESVSVAGALLEVAGSRAGVSGTVRLGKPIGLDLAVALDSLRAADLAMFVPSLPREGTASGRLAVRGEPKELHVSGALSTRYGAHELVADLVQVTIRPSEVSVDSLSGHIAGAAVAGTWLFPRGGGKEHHGVLWFRDVDLRAFAPPGAKVPESNISGVLTWLGSGWSAKTLDGEASLALGPGGIGEIPFEGIATEGRVAESRFIADRIDGSILGGDLEGAGEVAFSGDLDIAVTAQFADLSAVASYFHLEGAGGRGKFTGRIVRDRGGLLVDGTLDGETWQLNGFRLNQVDATGTLESRDGVLTVVASGEVGGIEGYGKTLGGVRAAVRYDGQRLFLDELAGRMAGVDFTARGEWVHEAEVDRFLITSLTVTRGEQSTVYPEPIEMRKEGSRFTLLPTSFPFREGRISMQGTYDLTGPIDVEARWNEVRLADISMPAAVPRELLEKTKGEVSISGTRQSPKIQLLASGSAASPDSAPRFASFNLSVEYAPGSPLATAIRFADAGKRERLIIEGTLADSLPSSLPQLSGGVRDALRVLLRPNLIVRTDSLQIEWLHGLVGALRDFGGPLTATWRFTGALDNMAATGPFAVSPLLYRRRVVAPLTGDVALGGDRLELTVGFPPEWGESRIHAVLPARLDAAAPRFAFQGDQAFSIDARVQKGDLAIFPLVIKEARDAQGEFTLSLTGSGTLAKPSLSGVLTIANGTVIVRDLVEVYEHVTGEVRIENNLFTIVSLTASEGEKGSVEASGSLRLVRWKADELDFTLRLREFDVESIPECGATINADLEINTGIAPPGGFWRCPHITGTIDIVGAVVEQNFRGGAEKPPPPAIFQPSETPDWTGQITIHALEDIWIDNDDMEIELRGDYDLTLFRSKRGLGLVGSLQVVGGTYRLYYSWIANELQVEEGEISWTDPDDAQRFRISATASTDLNGERIEVTAVGPPDTLIIHATSEGDLSESEIIQALAIQRESGDIGSAQLIGAWGTAFAQLLTRELTRGFRDIVDFDIVSAEGVRQWQVRREIVRHVGVTYQQDLASLPGSEPTQTTSAERLYLPDRQVKLQYRMTRAFYLEALTGSLRDGSRVYDLDLKWRLSY